MLIYVHILVFIDHIGYLLCLSFHIEFSSLDFSNSTLFSISFLVISCHLQRGCLLSARVFSASSDRNPVSSGSHIEDSYFLT